MALRQPFRIVLMPDQTVPADFHAMNPRKTDNRIAIRKSNPLAVGRKAGHFIAFSGSTVLYSRARVAEYAAWEHQ